MPEFETACGFTHRFLEMNQPCAPSATFLGVPLPCVVLRGMVPVFQLRSLQIVEANIEHLQVKITPRVVSWEC